LRGQGSLGDAGRLTAGATHGDEGADLVVALVGLGHAVAVIENEIETVLARGEPDHTPERPALAGA
jgi:hypothetical protein